MIRPNNNNYKLTKISQLFNISCQYYTQYTLICLVFIFFYINFICDWKKPHMFGPWSSSGILTPVVSVYRSKQQSTTNPEWMENENFLVQMIEELMREETLTDLLFANNSHYMVELSVWRGGNWSKKSQKSGPWFWTLGKQTLATTMLCLEESHQKQFWRKQVQGSWLIFKHLHQTQDWIIVRNRKSGKCGRNPEWVNKHLQANSDNRWEHPSNRNRELPKSKIERLFRDDVWVGLGKPKHI